MSEKTTVELKYPVTIDGTETNVLHVRMPKVRDEILADKAKKAGKSDAEIEVLLITNLCEVAPEVIEDLAVVDYKRLLKAYEDFLQE